LKLRARIVYGGWWTKRLEDQKLSEQDAVAQQDLTEWRIRIYAGHFKQHFEAFDVDLSIDRRAQIAKDAVIPYI